MRLLPVLPSFSRSFARSDARVLPGRHGQVSRGISRQWLDKPRNSRYVRFP
jgi:hypothetical protein